jgi:hypothetical protein
MQTYRCLPERTAISSAANANQNIHRFVAQRQTQLAEISPTKQKRPPGGVPSDLVGEPVPLVPRGDHVLQRVPGGIPVPVLAGDADPALVCCTAPAERLRDAELFCKRDLAPQATRAL